MNTDAGPLAGGDPTIQRMYIIRDTKKMAQYVSGQSVTNPSNSVLDLSMPILYPSIDPPPFSRAP